MQKHFVPPLPTPSSSSRLSSQSIQGSNEEDLGSIAGENGAKKIAGSSSLQGLEHDLGNKNQGDARTVEQSELINEDIENAAGEGHPLIAVDGTAQMDWPLPFDDETAIRKNALHLLSPDITKIKEQVKSSGKITVRSITWNQQAQEFPSIDVLQEHLLPTKYFHIVAVGTQECENSISKSILYPGKENWEKLCGEALGNDYELLQGHSLQASHL